MRKVFRHGDFLPKHEIHDKIIEFNTHTIITTNYDNLIEKAAENNSEVICVVSKDADLPYRKGGKELIKIHGDFESDNFVLKEDDYLSYSRNFRLIENYVKSIIGTKVVLFLGYSFSDPDIKQIFSWAKDILDGDFQRAYLIEAGKEYDANEADYYKNFGINVLYASLQLKTEFNKTDLTLNLLNMLKWLLAEDKLAKLDELYSDLKPFQFMNFASERYIKTAFYKAGLRVNDGYINEFDMGKGIDETGKIIRNLAYEQNMRIRLADNKQALNEEEIEKKERINKLLKDFKPEECDKEKIQAVLDILAKSDVCYIELHSPLENRNSWHRDCIELANYDPPDWVDAMNTFDYQVLENIIDKNNAHLAESRPQLYMEQGYLYYVLKEYLAAYNCFKMAAGIYYRHQEYFPYFIAEMNRFYVGKIVSDSNGAISGVSFEDAKAVREEIKAINLDRTYRSLPDFGGNNKILKDIYTFNIAYTLFQDAYLTSEKVREQAKANYIFFSGTAAFSSMRRNMKDYYNYIVLNQLAVDQYVENREIFKIYNNAEQIIFAYYKNQKLKSSTEKEPLLRISYPNDNSLIFSLVDLYLRGLIIDTESLFNIVKEQNINSVLWLMDYENYDYSFFDVGWLKQCSPNFLKEISSKDFVRKNISKRFVKAYNDGQADQRLLNIYFRYFAEILNENKSGLESV